VSAKKSRGKFYIARRFDVTISTTVVADNIDAALATAKAMSFADFMDSGDFDIDSAEDLRGTTISEMS
jgi:hypothetical protein